MKADGSVVIKFKLDYEKAEKELDTLKKKIEGLEEKLEGKENDRNAIKAKLDAAQESARKTEQRIKEINSELERAQKITSGEIHYETPAELIEAKELEEISLANLAEQTPILEEQQKTVAALTKDYERAEQACKNIEKDLGEAETEAGEIHKQLANASHASIAIHEAMDKAAKSADRFAKRMKKAVQTVFLFTIIYQGLSGVREWMGKVIQTNSEATQSMARLKGALLTLAQPLVNVLIPAFIRLVDVLTRVVTTVATLVSALFGTTIEASAQAAENLYKETEALTATGSAAKKASKSMASFDEINKLSSTESSSSGGSGSGGADFQLEDMIPDFSLFDVIGEKINGIAEKLKGVALTVGLIALGLGLWKLSDSFQGQLGNVLKVLGGISIALAGLIIMYKALSDAMENGVSWTNLLTSLLGAAVLVGGLALAFGKTGAAIGLVSAGAALLSVAMKDITENGLNLQNLLMFLAGSAGIIAGLGLAFGKMGVAIGLVGAGAAMMELAMKDIVTNGLNMQNMLMLLGGSVGIIAGLGLAFGKTGVAVGLLITAGVGLVTAFNDIIANGVNLQNMLLLIGSIVAGGLGFTLLTGSVIPLFIAAIATVVATILALTGNLQEFLVNIKENIFGGIMDIVNGFLTDDQALMEEGFKKLVKGIGNTIIIVVESILNMLVKGVNALITKVNGIKFKAPDWVPVIGGKNWGPSIQALGNVSLPRLAQGAVIPPNREFMAILGDQTSGTNIETPLDTMIQAFKTAMAETGSGTPNVNINFTGNLAQLARVLNPQIEVVQTQRGAHVVSVGGRNG